MRSDWYHALAARFDDHDLPLLATVCRALASRHALLTASADAVGVSQGEDPWPDGDTCDFAFEIASPRRLLESALMAEEADRRRAEALRAGTTEGAVLVFLDDAILVSRANAEALAAAIDVAPAAVEWECLMEHGIVPALALGAERRLNRGDTYAPATPPKSPRPRISSVR